MTSWADDLYPAADGWLVHVRIGVEMSRHEASSARIASSLLRLEAWLTHDLARSGRGVVRGGLG
jgi:hypothetical protein